VGKSELEGILIHLVSPSRSFKMAKRLELKNQRFSKLFVIEFAGVNSINHKTMWKVKCDCGNEFVVEGHSLKSGNTKACGCTRKESLIKRNFRHGLYFTRLHTIWNNMKERCTNPNHPNYIYYGGRGIKLCDEWQTFEGFIKDNGQSYEDHVKKFGEVDTTADRWPNVNGNYEPSNFRWATREEQIRNTRVSTKSIDFEEHSKQEQLWSSFLNGAIKRGNNTPLFEYRFDISLEGFKKHIKSQFTDGMNWNNHGKGLDKWNFDHIRGCNNFDLSKEEDRLICWNYKNLRPMWEKDHKEKSVYREEFLKI
jgi:hypothetical protein